MKIRDAFTFDDVLLEPARSAVLPANTNISTRLTQKINLHVPLTSAAMDTVTEHRLAIAMAQAGGIGDVHKNFTITAQTLDIAMVKKFEAGMVVNPLTIAPNQPLREALEMMEQNRISGIPVVEGNQRLVGILTNRDVRFATDPGQSVADLMTRNVVTVRDGTAPDEARRLLHEHRIEKLVVVDNSGACIGLITVKDMEKAQNHPLASKDDRGRLLVAAATGAGPDGIRRAEALIAAGADVIVVDTAHGHSEGVLESVTAVRKLANHVQIIGGNVATSDGAKALIDSGADAVKVGIGPGSICTTRMVAGVGVPQLTAIIDAADVCHKQNIPVIADGGIRYSGDMSKAVVAGASAVMMGSMLAGTEEAPGEIEIYQGRSYKSYRGMGSLGAMSRSQGSSDRYFQDANEGAEKLVPEGIEGRVPYKGPVSAIIHQMMGGLRSAMGYTGCSTMGQMRTQPEFVRVTSAGTSESHVHDVQITKAAPNYQAGGREAVAGDLFQTWLS